MNEWASTQLTDIHEKNLSDEWMEGERKRCMVVILSLDLPKEDREECKKKTVGRQKKIRNLFQG